ncbi:ATP-binding protein [Allostreptomyces psammosilenae]|uniref:Serine/threonine-protein kinase RsbT n=1 Tax=Allostreptomyces psammosilenae TaxID=1892865 RepID=A0A853A8T9_9ACTN|nr:ATP-binding protein [Allostreptomyces psammosilenae]NYI06938.1 serine/threonine-protein kinase RsbT [Allostreptomyces psammosilenae]
MADSISPSFPEELAIATDADVVRARQAVRAATVAAGFSLVEQTKLVTAASELARNCLVHGGGGRIRVQLVRSPVGRAGVRMVVEDTGPGIPDVETALSDGYTTGTGLGFGLGGARRLVHDFEVDSAPGRGTTVTAVRWAGR